MMGAAWPAFSPRGTSVDCLNLCGAALRGMHPSYPRLRHSTGSGWVSNPSPAGTGRGGGGEGMWVYPNNSSIATSRLESTSPDSISPTAHSKYAQSSIVPADVLDAASTQFVLTCRAPVTHTDKKLFLRRLLGVTLEIKATAAKWILG